MNTRLIESVRDLDCSGERALSQKLWRVRGSYVVTSYAEPRGVGETYVFRATEQGTITSWSALPGSFRSTAGGPCDHLAAVLGYAESLS